MPVCSNCGRMAATAEMRRRKPPYTGEYRCKAGCREVKSPGQIVVGETRVLTPNGPGLAIEIHRSLSYPIRRRTPATIVVELDSGERRAFIYSQLRSAA